MTARKQVKKIDGVLQPVNPPSPNSVAALLTAATMHVALHSFLPRIMKRKTAVLQRGTITSLQALYPMITRAA